MATQNTTTTPQRTARRAAVASLVGTTIEWFDFFIYGLAAALVFGDLFFPAYDEHTGRLASFATLAVAFLARPVGAAIFGHLGDRLGRKSTLIATLGIMGAATGLIGCLPTYSSIGLWAPVLLIVLRLFQGLAVGGEWGGAVLMSVEHAPASKVRLYGAAPQMGSPLGLVLATLVMAAIGGLPDDQLLSWGWRIPFLAGFVLVAVGLVIRLGVAESAEFAEVKETGTRSRIPLRDVVAHSGRGLLSGIGLQAGVNVVFYVISVYFLSYAVNSLGLARSTALVIVTVAAAVDMLCIPLFAHLGDRFGARRVFVGGTVFTVVAAFPFFLLLNTGNVAAVAVTITVMLVFAHATTYAVVSSMIAELFPTRVRYSGTALSNALGGLVFSAPTPFLAEALVGGSGGTWWPLSVMVVVAALISVAAVAARPRRTGDTPEPTAPASHLHDADAVH
ncbi:MFS transporter [Pseudonocardia kunmingensis]|uniref:Putative MFS family arabinose efflux permease n=1 Tax=Pseudonocardia kunmingensis TaxID=630975 RepID=A0A543DPN9_9PSEU|nr:MFS transporter [Pseudonocardia kunmingensis]TQM11290.1 putative MFS family arabinose efflux permease [Pseudonocardia kunmingensis]